MYSSWSLTTTHSRGRGVFMASLHRMAGGGCRCRTLGRDRPCGDVHSKCAVLCGGFAPSCQRGLHREHRCREKSGSHDSSRRTPDSLTASSAMRQDRQERDRKMNMKRKICILGSTGSIGTQALQVIEEHANLFEAYALTAGSNADLLSRSR